MKAVSAVANSVLIAAIVRFCAVPPLKKTSNDALIALIFPVTASEASTMTGYVTTPRYWITLDTSIRLVFKPGSKSRSRDGNAHSAAHRWRGTLVSATSVGRINPTTCHHYRAIKSNVVTLKRFYIRLLFSLDTSVREYPRQNKKPNKPSVKIGTLPAMTDEITN